MRDQDRPGFGERFDRVVFTIEQHGLDGLCIMIWVDAAYRPDRTEAVARAFLAARLTRMTTAVMHATMTTAEVDALWDMLQHITPKGRST